MIFLEDVLKTMELTDAKSQLQPFSIEFVTANRSKRTGGDLIKISKAVLLKKIKSSGEKSTQQVNPAIERKANHWENSTRNILLPNGQVRKLHIRLITRFNNNPVIF